MCMRVVVVKYASSNHGIMQLFIVELVATPLQEMIYKCEPRYSCFTDHNTLITSLHKKISKKKSTPCRDGSMHECTG